MTNEEAIKRIHEHMIVHKMNEPRAVHISEALYMAIKALEQKQWIPVSERLPECDDFVLVTCKMPYGNLCTYLEILRRTNDGSWTDNLDYYSPDSVIAWMPLPEPYEAESEEA